MRKWDRLLADNQPTAHGHTCHKNRTEIKCANASCITRLTCPPNWLQGKAMMLNPRLLSFSYIAVIATYDDLVLPHLQATLTTRETYREMRQI